MFTPFVVIKAKEISWIEIFQRVLAIFESALLVVLFVKGVENIEGEIRAMDLMPRSYVIEKFDQHFWLKWEFSFLKEVSDHIEKKTSFPFHNALLPWPNIRIQVFKKLRNQYKLWSIERQMIFISFNMRMNFNSFLIFPQVNVSLFPQIWPQK